VYAENLLALGIQPVGVADIRGYQKYVNVQPSLAESVVDIGTRQEPSLEAIAQLKPDLILGVELRHQTIYDTLSAIAPTLLFNPYP
jgi:ferric hydroxamate transport system substrate-binding protein